MLLNIRIGTLGTCPSQKEDNYRFIFFFLKQAEEAGFSKFRCILALFEKMYLQKKGTISGRMNIMDNNDTRNYS
jgi:hypothetical protein